MEKLLEQILEEKYKKDKDFTPCLFTNFIF